MRQFRSALVAVIAVGCVIAVAACGSSSKKSSSSAKPTATTGGTVTMTFGTAPDTLDPQGFETTQAGEVDGAVYIPPYYYAAANGSAGTQIIPALATALPTISKDGKTYSFFFRKGLKYSNGQPLHASDFVTAVERAIKIPWPLGSAFLVPLIQGATDYEKGKSNTVSGITTNDATGQVTIRLTQPYGAFENALAFQAYSPVPKGTPMKNLANSPPPGIGPYKFSTITPNASITEVKNPNWTPIPGIPTGYVDKIVSKISSNTTASALSVLNNTSDVFDWADTIPPSLLTQIASQASDRYKKLERYATYYFFLNQKTKPFSSLLAREAVIVGLDRPALARLGSGFFLPGCFFLPPTMVGHPPAGTPCPFGVDPSGHGDIAKARALVKQSGMAGTPVTVWGEERVPRRQFVDYYTSFLNQIGFKATEKIIADATYFPTIGTLKLNPQTGFDDYNQDFPNPIDFYGLLLAGDAITPTGNLNNSQVNDPVVNSKVNMIGSLYKTPTSDLSAVTGDYNKLETYVASKAYEGVFGYLEAPQFVSNKIDQSVLIFGAINGYYFNTFKLK
jgi:peptide/nickel transport system substrate-binding protein